YIGGGTPSLVEPEWIERLLGSVRARARVEHGAEITLEANPESVTRDRAGRWLAAGVGRLSLGVQSLDDAVLPRRGRQYDAEGAGRAAGDARAAGFVTLGVDLIAGLPAEPAAGFTAGVARVIDLRPEHVAVYLLETGESLKDTPLERAVREGREHLPDDETMV